MNLLEIQSWLSVRQADALTGGPIVLTDVYELLILLISYVSSSTVLKFTFNLSNTLFNTQQKVYASWKKP